MYSNSYVGIVPPEIPRLIVRRAHRYRVSADEIEDLQQKIIPLLADFHFDPARAHGATLATVMTGVIDRQIKAYLRSKRRYLQHIEHLQSLTSKMLIEGTAISYQVVPPDPVDLRLDLERMTGQLAPRDREVCQLLADGLSVAAIAQQLACGRDTVDRAIVRIRKKFTALGLEAWMGQ